MIDIMVYLQCVNYDYDKGLLRNIRINPTVAHNSFYYLCPVQRTQNSWDSAGKLAYFMTRYHHSNNGTDISQECISTKTILIKPSRIFTLLNSR